MNYSFGDMVKLYRGDCLEELNNVEGRCVSLILCDLLYGTTAHNEWDKKIPLEPLWEQWLRVLKPDGVIALWSQMPFAAELIMSQPKLFRYEWVIEKANPTGFLNARRMPMKCHENVLIFYRKLPMYNPQMTHGHERKVSTAKHRRNCAYSDDYGSFTYNTYDSTNRFPRDVLKFSWDKQKSRLHPTQKPVAANEYFIKTYTEPGDIVLDCCMGSGTTGVAALNLSRRFVGIELSEEYFAIAESRLKTESHPTSS